jgi:hypothetical protein
MSIEIDVKEDSLFVQSAKYDSVPKKWAEADFYASVEAMRQLRDLKRDQRGRHAQP